MSTCEAINVHEDNVTVVCWVDELTSGGMNPTIEASKRMDVLSGPIVFYYTSLS
jgi:hypothetical protein